MPQKIIITGGAGFIGHHLCEHIHKHTDWDIIIIDKLSYASKGLSRLRNNGLISSKRIVVYTIDLVQPISDGIKLEIGEVDYIVHLAAETHIDSSIAEPVRFIHNNIMSTVNLLEYARCITTLKKFFYFSTDEVFGPAPGTISFKELDVHKPTNPYSASKSAAENIAMSYKNTYKLPVLIVNVMNAMGERQHIEKFIPKCIKYILEEKNLNIHADKKCEVIGSRFYIHARNISSAVLFLIDNGNIGEKYNITGEIELSNLEIAQSISKIMNKPLKYTIIDAETERNGHDCRYCLSGEKLSKLGWKPPIDFQNSLEKTILWTMNNLEWLE
jgi:dTDP-glucose 4,6-dehydratase